MAQATAPILDSTEVPLAIGQSNCPLCPNTSDFDLLSDGKRIIYLDPEITDRTFHFRVAKQKLDRTQIACATIDRVALVRRSECVPK